MVELPSLHQQTNKQQYNPSHVMLQEKFALAVVLAVILTLPKVTLRNGEHVRIGLLFKKVFIDTERRAEY